MPSLPQSDSIYGGEAGGGGVAAAIINAALYGATGLGLYYMSKRMDDQGKNVAFKADETMFDKTITFDDIAGMDESKVGVPAYILLHA